MKKIIPLIYAVAALCFFSCSEDTIDTVVTGTLTGKIMDHETEEPLHDVKITTKPAYTTVFTDTLGNFIIKNIPTDEYAVQAELEGYTTGFQAVTILEGETSAVSIKLRPSDKRNLPPAPPELIAPEDGETDLGPDVTLIWQATDPENDELNFTVSLRNGRTDESEIFEVAQDTSLTLENLQLATKYFWQVTVSDGVNDPVSSPISEFKTLTTPDNPFLFVREKAGNLVIYSGEKDTVPGNQQQSNYNVLQLTSENINSFRPRRSTVLNRIAFLSNSGGSTHIFTMEYDGTDIRQVTRRTPVAGFKTEELTFTWARNDSKIYYPNFDKLYSVNYDGTGTELIYQTPDGSFISEVSVPAFDDDLILLKTNNAEGYNVRIFTISLSSGSETAVILENKPGAACGIDITANADCVLYTWDKSESQNPVYQIFESRAFVYNLTTGTEEEINTGSVQGENDLQTRFNPSEGGIIYTRVKSNFGAVPDIYSYDFGQTTGMEVALFTSSFMPDWE